VKRLKKKSGSHQNFGVPLKHAIAKLTAEDAILYDFIYNVEKI
jgi:hypothetical protein